MQVKITEQKNNKAKIAVTVPTADVEKYFDQAIKQISEREKFEGFRPGKAPRKVVESKIGTDKIHAEVIKLFLITLILKPLNKQKSTRLIAPRSRLLNLPPKTLSAIRLK